MERQALGFRLQASGAEKQAQGSRRTGWRRPSGLRLAKQEMVRALAPEVPRRLKPVEILGWSCRAKALLHPKVQGSRRKAETAVASGWWLGAGKGTCAGTGAHTTSVGGGHVGLRHGCCVIEAGFRLRASGFRKTQSDGRRQASGKHDREWRREAPEAGSRSPGVGWAGGRGR